MATGGENSSDIDVGCATLRSCEPCKKDNTTKDATQFCTECVEFLCDDCKRGHSRFKAGNHSFIFAADVTDVPVVVDMKDIDKCEEHKKKLKFFCKDHSFLCCSTCAFIHRTCKSVEEIAKISDKMRENLKELHDSLVKAGDKERLKIEDCTKTVDTLEGKVTQFQKTIDTKKEETIKLFETAKSRITNEANTIIANESERLGKRKISSENTVKIISEILPLCLGVINNGTPQQAFILAKYIEQKLIEIDIKDREQSKTHFAMHLSLEFAEETQSLLRKGPAVVKLIDERLNINTDHDSGCKQYGAVGSVSPSPTIVPTGVKTCFGLKQLNSLNCTVAGMDFLPDKRLVVAYADKQCIVMDDQLQKQGKPFCLSYDPVAVVCVSNTDVAVMTECTQIVIISVSQDNIMTLKRTLSTTQQYHSFCIVDSNTIFAIKKQEMKGAKISVLDGKESLFNKVQFKKRAGDVNPSDYYCSYINGSDTLIVCDTGNQRVYIYNTATGTSTDVKLDETIIHVSSIPDKTVLVFCCHSIVNISLAGQVLSKYTCTFTNRWPHIICVSKDCTRFAATYSYSHKMDLMELKLT